MSLSQLFSEAPENGEAPFLSDSLPPVFARLAERIGIEKLRARLIKQSTHSAGLRHQGEGVLSVERFIPIDSLVTWGLRLCCLSNLGRHFAQSLQVEHNTVASPSVPPPFDGFRILQLSDLHTDLDTGILPVLAKVLPSVEYDLAVITGDYRNETLGDFASSISETQKVIRLLRPPVLGILGNHDFLEMVPELEDAGLSLLLNETASLDRGGASLRIAGIDDPHFYQTHDIPKVAGEIAAEARAGNYPQGIFRLLLSHSPETYREAEAHFDLHLSGHTHGGQICLPGGIPLIRNGNCSKEMIAGAWRYGKMHGYTSRGTGCCGVAARFFCPPEITVHTLRRTASEVPEPQKKDA